MRLVSGMSVNEKLRARSNILWLRGRPVDPWGMQSGAEKIHSNLSVCAQVSKLKHYLAIALL